MDKGQAHVAVILIMLLAAIIGGVFVVVFVLNDPATTTVPGGTPMNIPGTPTPSGAPITRGAMVEGNHIMITESNNIADFVNAKIVTENEAWATGTPECDLTATPFSQNGVSQDFGIRTCGMGNEIADLGVTNIPAARMMSSSTFTWVSNPTALVGHVYMIKARDGSEHLIEVTNVDSGTESVTFIWEKA